MTAFRETSLPVHDKPFQRSVSERDGDGGSCLCESKGEERRGALRQHHRTDGIMVPSPASPPAPSVAAKSCGRRRRTGRLRTLYTPTPVPGSRRAAATVGMSVLYIAPLPLPFPPYLSPSTASDRPHTGVGASRRQAAAVSTTQWLRARCGPRARNTCMLPWGTWTKR